MKLFLPSEGICGQKSVSLKRPTFGIIHEIQQYNDDEFLRKVKFVELVSDANLEKITWWDLCYIFDVAAFAALLNRASFKVTCIECGNSFTHNLSLGECDIKQLTVVKSDLPRRIFKAGKLHSFHLLSAKDVVESYEYAQYRDNEDNAFYLAKLNRAMGKKVNSSYSRDLPLSVATAAEEFQRILYHGFVRTVTCKCPHCGTEFVSSWQMSTKVLEFKNEALLDRFVSVSDILTFKDFMNISLSDFDTLVGILNKKAR